MLSAAKHLLFLLKTNKSAYRGRALIFVLLLVTAGINAHRCVAQEATPKTPSKRAQQPAEHPAIIRALSEEVLLDLVARDKHGRAVRDLKPDEIEVFEDGVKQQITSFRLVEGEAAVPIAPRSAVPAAQREASLGQVNLVSLVFERLGEEGRIHAREGALAFLKSELRPNVYVAVFTNDKALYVLQQFTNDRQRLQRAVDMATKASANQMAAQSASIVRELETATGQAAQASAAAGAAAAGMSTSGRAGGGASLGAAMAEAQMAQMTVDMIQTAALLTRQQEGRSSLYSLLSLVREQRRLPGRKTIIYFSQGLNMTPALMDLLSTTVSEANRSNVSVYSVDARGLMISDVGDASRGSMLGAESGLRFDPDSGRTVGGEYTFEVAARANVQDTLADLSRSTGGFLVANTNEMEIAMRRIAEDIRSYYAVAYKPSAHEYDGRFHRITVKVLRPGITLQARSGYFAAPPVGGSPVFSYEVPMLAALKSVPLAQSFEYRAQAFHFEYTTDGLQCHLVVEVPISDFDFEPGTNKDVVHAHFSVMALVDGSDGNALLKFSQDYPFEGPSIRMDSLRKGTVVFARDFRLPAGRYTLETVVFDQQTQKSSVHRSVLMVPPSPHGVTLSTLSIIGRLDPVTPSDQGNADPLRFQSSEIIPNLGEPIHQGVSAGVPLYFVVYPSAQTAEKPQVELELSRGGRVIASAPVELPAPDSSGSIHYVGTIPVGKFQPGRYEIRALARQGAAAVEEYAFFTID